MVDSSRPRMLAVVGQHGRSCRQTPKLSSPPQRAEPRKQPTRRDLLQWVVPNPRYATALGRQELLRSLSYPLACPVSKLGPFLVLRAFPLGPVIRGSTKADRVPYPVIEEAVQQANAERIREKQEEQSHRHARELGFEMRKIETAAAPPRG